MLADTDTRVRLPQVERLEYFILSNQVLSQSPVSIIIFLLDIAKKTLLLDLALAKLVGDLETAGEAGSLLFNFENG